MSYQLQPDDILCFVHIPKTAGMSINSILEAQFDKSEIFPNLVLHWRPSLVWPRLLLIRMNRYRLVRGHFPILCPDNFVRRALPVEPVVITMLREPLARTISNYRHDIRQHHIPQHMTLLEYITAPQFEDSVTNFQTYWLSGDRRNHPGRAHVPAGCSLQQVLDRAKQNLEEIAYFGIVEHFAESLQFLCDYFGWDTVAELPQVNRAPQPFDLSTLTAQEQDELHKRLALDIELYDYAVKLFHERYPGVPQ